MKNVAGLIKPNALILGLFMMSFVTVKGQPIVLYDMGSPQRPISVTDLIVNGIIYDVTIIYNIPIEGATLSGIPFADLSEAQIGLVDALNAAMIESNLTRLNLVYSDDGPNVQYCLVLDNTTGIGDWFKSECGSGTDFSASNSEGLVLFTQTGIVPIVPTLSQWGIAILFLSFIIVGTIAVRQRRTDSIGMHTILK